MASTKTRSTLTTHCVNLINKDNTWRVLLRILKQISYTRSTTPTNISTKSEPLIVKNGVPASPATALASNVLPVPGGPTSSTPFGMVAPTSLNLRGSFRKSTTSTSSCFSSSAPATSL